MPPAAPATIRFSPVREEPDPEALELAGDGDCWTLAEAMARLKVSRPTIYKFMDCEGLAYVQTRPGCRRMIPKEALRRFVAGRMNHAAKTG
jgi:excisionase family DNA binding protein